MTDEQIIKALECCAGKGCKQCPKNINSAHCIMLLMEDALDLINRQKAEIERLKICNEGQRDTIRIYQIGETRAEAIKEFAAKVEQKCLDIGIYPACVKRAVEETKREMTEQDND